MPIDEIPVQVSVEAAVHNALRETAQLIWDKFGLFIQQAKFTYRDESTMDEEKMVVSSVEVTTETKR